MGLSLHYLQRATNSVCSWQNAKGQVLNMLIEVKNRKIFQGAGWDFLVVALEIKTSSKEGFKMNIHSPVYILKEPSINPQEP